MSCWRLFALKPLLHPYGETPCQSTSIVTLSPSLPLRFAQGYGSPRVNSAKGLSLGTVRSFASLRMTSERSEGMTSERSEGMTEVLKFTPMGLPLPYAT